MAMSPGKRLLIVLLILAGVLVGTSLITTFTEAFKVPSSSMENTVMLGDHIFVNMVAYGINSPLDPREKLASFDDPQRGDVVVFLYPEDPSRKFIKRVIGLPGDTLEIRDRQVFINEKPLDEPYKIHKPEFAGLTLEDFDTVTVPKGYYFLMGDNRDNSKDSRAWGYVPRSYILGKAVFVYMSYESESGMCWDRIGTGIQ